MAPADIFPARKSRNVKKKKREREIDRDRVFDLYSNSERANFSLPRPDIGPTLTFPPVTVTPEDGTYFSSHAIAFDKCHSYLYYGVKFPLDPDLFSNRE